MKKILRTVAITGLVLLASCGKINNLESLSNTNSYDAPEVSSEGKESFEMLGEVNPNNLGYTLDMNADGIDDFAIMRGNIVYFKAGRGSGRFGKETPILKINENIVAYRIGGVKNQDRPSIVFFLADKKGYFQPNLGSNPEGIPYFGEIESIK